MQIAKVTAWRMLQPFVDGTYKMSKGRHADAFDAVIVALTTPDGTTGWGEMAPLGTFYSEAFTAGAEAGIRELAPRLLGLDPRAVASNMRLMDTLFMGHPYVKSAIDMAMWDLTARLADVPLVTALGGREGDSCAIYRVVTHGPPETMIARARDIVASGCNRLQIKVGGDVTTDIEKVTAVLGAIPSDVVAFCDANAGWTAFEARQFTKGTRNLSYVFEQPCATLDACADVRRGFDGPMVLDESVTGLVPLLDIHRRGIAEGVTLKISRLGGIGATRKLRDLAVDMGLKVTVEDTGGAEIDTAAMAHLSLSTPAEYRLNAIAFQDWVTTRTAANATPLSASHMGLPDGPGLGIEVLPDLLGTPFLHIGP